MFTACLHSLPFSVYFSPSQHCFAGIIPTNFKLASAEMLIRYMVHNHTKTRINWLVKHTLGILFRACFLIFCSLDRLTFSKSLNSGPFLLNKSFFISLLSHFIRSTFLSFFMRRNQATPSTLCFRNILS